MDEIEDPAERYGPARVQFLQEMVDEARKERDEWLEANRDLAWALEQTNDELEKLRAVVELARAGRRAAETVLSGSPIANAKAAGAWDAFCLALDMLPSVKS